MLLEVLIFLISIVVLSFPLSYIDPDNVSAFNPALLVSLIILGTYIYRYNRHLIRGVFPILLAVVFLQALQHNVYSLAPALLVLGFVLAVARLPHQAVAYAIPSLIIAALIAWPLYYTNTWVIASFLGFFVLTLSWYVVPNPQYLLGAVGSGILLSHYLRN